MLQIKEDTLGSFSHSVLFWATTRIGLHALMLKKHIGFFILSTAAALYSVKAPVSLKVPFVRKGDFLSHIPNSSSNDSADPSSQSQSVSFRQVGKPRASLFDEKHDVDLVVETLHDHRSHQDSSSGNSVECLYKMSWQSI